MYLINRTVSQPAAAPRHGHPATAPGAAPYRLQDFPGSLPLLSCIDARLRGKVITGPDGRFELRTITPAPYTVPHDGPFGRLLAACGWHP